MRAAGLCHTDVSQVRDARFTPILLGHEGAGEVESVGPGVEDLEPGDPVLVCWKVPCGRCRRCAPGRSRTSARTSSGLQSHVSSAPASRSAPC